jgi:hypothetical protein
VVSLCTAWLAWLLYSRCQAHTANHAVPDPPIHPCFPAEVLGSILGALKSIVAVIGMTRMTPPIKDLLPRLTPILKNRCVGLGRAEVGSLLRGWTQGQPAAAAVPA